LGGWEDVGTIDYIMQVWSDHHAKEMRKKERKQMHNTSNKIMRFQKKKSKKK